MNEGYGPESEWPRPDDNEEYLALMNIQRRDIVELNEPQAWVSWLLERPAEEVIYRLSRFFNRNTHRRLKQAVFCGIIVFGSALYVSGLFCMIIWPGILW